MADPTIVFRATFRARGYSEADLAELYSELSEVAAVRLRGEQRPEAGGVAELTAVLEFIGVNLAKGGFAWIGGKILQRATTGIGAWWRRKAQRGPWAPEVGTFRASFDDVDVDFYAHRYDDEPDAVLTAEAIEAIPDVMRLVGEHFDPARIQEQRVAYIGVPLICYDPSEPEFGNEKNGTPARFWKIGRGAPFPTDLYDSVTREYADLPRDVRVGPIDSGDEAA